MIDAFNANKLALKNLGMHGQNIYALWRKDKKQTEWNLMYVGERKAGQIHSRLKDHLFYKNDKTGSKLNLVIESLERGCDIAVSVVAVRPDELRTSVEERITKEFIGGNLWNIHNKKS